MSKKAVLVVSFGTSHDETREKTIGAVERDIANHHPELTVRRAFTSGIIQRKLAKRGIEIDTVAKALERLCSERFEEVAILPTHIIPGEEYEKLCVLAQDFCEKFRSLKIAKPLLYSTDDILAFSKVLADRYPPVPGEALVFMGHGTQHQANMVYPALNFVFEDINRQDIFVGTVEGYPEVDTILRKVQDAGYQKVALVPLMLVAGDHAVNDMAGEEPESWKSIFEGEGFETRCVIEGLGELACIRSLYQRHLENVLEEMSD